MERIVITGATGFLGRNLAHWFLDRGYEVYALVRPDSGKAGLLPDHGHLIRVDCAMEQAETCVEKIGRADGWFHFAWGGVNREEIDSPAVQRQNIRGSMACVKAAYGLGCRVFMDAGSRVEYGVTSARMDEALGCQPVNEYGKAKLAFYRQAAPLCRKYGLSYFHLRFFSVYGYGDHPWSIISTLVRELPRGKTVNLSACLHEWNFMYIADAAEAVGRLYERQRGGVPGGAAVNIASRDTRVLRSFVEEVQELAGGCGTLRYGAFVQAREGALSIRPDVLRMEELTGGFQERYTFRQGITEMIKKEMERKDEENQRIDPML